MPLASLARSSRHVRAHLTATCGTANGLDIGTDVGLDNTVVTIIRNRWRADRPWTQSRADDLAAAARLLPGASVRLHSVRDMVVVVWAGAA